MTPWHRRLRAWALHPAQAAATWAILGLLRALPTSWAATIGAALARCVGPRLTAHRTMTRNLAAALPEVSAAVRARIADGVWDNLGRNAGEWASVGRYLTPPGDQRLDIVGGAALRAAVAQGRGVLAFSAHMANWEMAPVAFARLGAPLAAVYRPSSNPWLDRSIIHWRRAYCGAQIPKGRGGARRILALVKGGGTLGFLIDQKLNEGAPIRFFGRAAMTATAMAELALRFQLPLLPVRVERLPRSRFRITFHPPLSLPDSGNRNADVLTLMTTVNELLEAWIRERPEQWFWVHQRWPREAVDAPVHDRNDSVSP